MPSKQVTIQGVMTWEGSGGPGDGGEHPAHPIMGPGIPTHPIAGPPPGIWPSPGTPTHPIAGPPPGIWPSPGTPTHPIVIPPEAPPPLDMVAPPAVNVPVEYTLMFSPTYGYVLIPAKS
jgi:hypothetical protein